MEIDDMMMELGVDGVESMVELMEFVDEGRRRKTDGEQV
jgi:hypothetical protein